MENTDNEVEIALLYYKNRKVDNNMQRAASFLKSACDKNNAYACVLLGSMYADGDLEQNSVKALKLFEKSCELGHPEACYNAAIMYGQGDGTTVNYERALELLKISCEEINLGCEEYYELKNILELEKKLNLT